ncbi:hypothetical protein CYMTET_18821 [Cymbomonas tetramitiformis]|uniref:Uncharacterized protein n=1 Tax=Cymbomonas tetramitiformis TaxID=36881 RepID=A0AAE0G7U9_9CHLO|nr:hypothetical protein CYMTET_18821 [Cymbomonas tetramitiformis]
MLSVVYGSPSMARIFNPAVSLPSKRCKPALHQCQFRKPPVVAEPSYNLAVGTVALGASLLALPGSGLADFPGGLITLIGVFFAVQTSRIRFLFDETAFELLLNGTGEDLESSGENIVVGGANRWEYSSFVNWTFFPSLEFPILVYFKETQTPEEQWNEGPGQLDKVGGGQVHFFPALVNCQQLAEEFERRGCAEFEGQQDEEQ